MNQSSVYPLSYKQRSMWFLNQLTLQEGVYNVLFSAKIISEIDVLALERALQTLINRHPILRTNYTIDEGEPVQKISDRQEVDFTQINVVKLNETELNNLIIDLIRSPFNLEKDSVLRVRLLTIYPTEHIFLFIIHHIINDAWSKQLLLDELSCFYAIETGKNTISPPLPLQQYTDFVKWQKEMLTSAKGERHWQYWQKQLAGDLPVLNLPIDKPRPPIQTYNGLSQSLILNQEFLEQLKILAKAEGITLYTLLLSAFQVLLYHYTKQEDIIIGSLMNGRTKNEFLNIIGDIANFIVIRGNTSGNPTFKTFLNQVRQKVTGALLHQDYPFNLLVEKLVKKRDPSRSPIYQVIFNMPQVNTPTAKERVSFYVPNHDEVKIYFGGLEMKPFFIKQNMNGSVDLGLTIWEVDDSLICMWGCNSDLFHSSTITKMMSNFKTLLESILANPDEQIANFPLSISSCKLQQQKIAIAATFTSEPIGDSLNFWLQELELDLSVEFAPYNQIFQQLLNPDSLFSQNQQGFNVILFRWEDWYKSDYDFASELNKNLDDFILALKSAALSVPHLICICPPSPQQLTDSEKTNLFQTLEQKILDNINLMNGVYCVTTSELNNIYPVINYYDNYGEKNGHIPYKNTLFIALSSIIARKLHAITRNLYKVIVLDCDQTLWKGICAEDGVNGVEVDFYRQNLQQFMLKQKQSGMLLVLCSKNQEEDVWEVFEKHPSMILKREDLVSYRINWQAKSENLQSLAKELNLSLDSFIFIDDNPVECAEIRANCPEVLTLELPQDETKIPLYLNHFWGFDRLKITETDQQRTVYYQQNQQREISQKQALTFADFLAGLELEVNIYPLQHEQITRVAELTQRTNQFNFTTIRRSENEIKKLWELGELECLVVEVKDRFGDYGKVGLMMFNSQEKSLVVDTFLLSCRALGKGIEHQMLAYLGNIAENRGLNYVNLVYLPTDKNKPIENFTDSMVAEFKQPIDKGWQFILPVDLVIQTKFVPKNYVEKLQKNDIKLKLNYNYSFLFERIMKELSNTEKLEEIIEIKNYDQNIENVFFVKPRNSLEQKIVEIWSQVLRLEKIGIYDNFFELGGDSIKATIAINKLGEEFNKLLPVVSIFETPTVVQFCEYIKQKYPEIVKNYDIILPVESLNLDEREEGEV